ncbi:helix-turn-helix domain-containing protein [Paenibacillus sp. HWE-109]|uniref:helix-turn-helix domain-containing protein n=1 Tax=Paenibacillus sp. HWE-109 TaxID=1306526 RepID=UPI001EDD807D|nr:helix-turn-helix domain-containing protein [Paenibacillus sp. HWE-109]UKS25154.1 helix-turn-helix domain-containing protein [Paenibacillus sp. HWE-109]
MALIEMTIPPFPHYITSGFNTIPKNAKHPSRSHIEVFDLLITTSGCLFLAEEEQRFEVAPGQALILRPDCYHFATQVCAEDTSTYWMHFHAGGLWNMVDNTIPALPLEDPSPVFIEPFAVEPFTIRIPQYTTLLQPEKTYELFEQLHQLQPRAHMSGVRFAQQQLFHELLLQLSVSATKEQRSPSLACAEKAASYLRQHYRETVSAKALGDHVNFHPVYIARCMQREYGCSPTEYLLRLRIQQAKLLLLQTDLPVAHVGEEVGFEQPAYFATCFTRLEGISPRKYRQRFARN